MDRIDGIIDQVADRGQDVPDNQLPSTTAHTSSNPAADPVSSTAAPSSHQTPVRSALTPLRAARLNSSAADFRSPAKRKRVASPVRLL